MGELYQDRWIEYLPWALLGRRTAYNKDLGTSSSELTLGTHVAVPGCILPEVDDAEPSIKDILQNLQLKNNRVSVPTSTNYQKPSDPPPDSVTHVYTKQHDTRGLEPSYRGPFLVVSRPSRSTVEIKVGVNKNGENRTELRAWSDLKPAYLREGVTEAQRPKRGRPRKVQPSPEVLPEVSHNSLPQQSTDASRYNLRPRKQPPEVALIDFSKPPPEFKPVAPNSKLSSTAAEPLSTTGPPPWQPFTSKPSSWSASALDLDVINRSIAGSPVRCEARG